MACGLATVSTNATLTFATDSHVCMLRRWLASRCRILHTRSSLAILIVTLLLVDYLEEPHSDPDLSRKVAQFVVTVETSP